MLPPTESTPLPRRPSGGVSRLVVTQGPSAGKTLVLTRARATVGRHPTNDLVIADPRVSATHLELERRAEGRVLVRDLETTNGTFIGAHRLLEMELGPGALLRIGDSAVRVELDDRAEPERGSDAARFGPLVGSSPEMRELFATLERIAPTQLTVLAHGETGTGKEELARAIHACSTRKSGPFVVLDAATIPPSLAESILFGHERGSFTGADARHIGAFERAHGGTLFLDEVGELPLDLQPKLLRVLETRVISRVGGVESIPVDFRLVAATHRDLRVEIDAHRFREDLYYRLAEARVVLPPLRARPADIPLLAQRFLEELSGEEPISMTPEAVESLLGRRWPGNVRELRNVIARAVALSADRVITAADLSGEGFGFRGSMAERQALDLGGTFAEAKARAVERFEAAYLDALLRRCGGNLSKASRQADIARNHLRALLKKRGLYDPGDT
ncbi:MAG: sigma 54-interacting transcriptional regulator [Byssovorax sp.]